MPNLDFSLPQRESKAGILLIFATAVFHIIRNFWFVGIYLIVDDIDPDILFFILVGVVSLLALTLIYSILYYLRFLFFVDQEKKEFVLQKGVFSTKVITLPFEKIQQVHFKRSLLQRLIGVYSVMIDTAGSKEKEVEIKALKKEQADALAEILMTLSSAPKEGSEIVSEDDQEVQKASRIDWTYKLKPLTLLKLGLTSNYLRGLALLVAFYFSLKEQLGYNEAFEVPEVQLMELFSKTLLIFLLFLMGMLLTVMEVFLKYYNLKVSKSHSGLMVEMGLKENTKVSILPRRVQVVEIGTNPIQRRLNLYKLKVSLASAQNDIEKDRIVIPALPKEVVEKIEMYLYDSVRKELNRLVPHKLLLVRLLVKGVAPLLAVGVFFLFAWFPTMWSWQVILSSSLIYLVVIIGFQLLFYNSLNLSISKDFLVKESGVWIRKREIVEMYKLQAVTLVEPSVYRKRKLVKMVFHTAGGDVSFALVKKEEALPLFNYLIYRIEKNSKAWM